MESKQIIQLKNHWSFWEIYKTVYNQDKKDYQDTSNMQLKTNDFREMTQFLMNSVFSKPSTVFFNKEGKCSFVQQTDGKQQQIESLGLFKNDIRPVWEDPLNEKGSEVQIKFDIDLSKEEKDINSALESVNLIWQSLIAYVLSEDDEEIQTITGIRVCDKTNFKYSKRICFRFEFWTTLANELKTEQEIKDKFIVFYDKIKKKIEDLSQDEQKARILHDYTYKSHTHK